MSTRGVLAVVARAAAGAVVGNLIGRVIVARRRTRKLTTWEDDGWGDLPPIVGARRSHRGRWIS
jgi:hypothetical protein